MGEIIIRSGENEHRAIADVIGFPLTHEKAKRAANYQKVSLIYHPPRVLPSWLYNKIWEVRPYLKYLLGQTEDFELEINHFEESAFIASFAINLEDRKQETRHRLWLPNGETKKIHLGGKEIIFQHNP